MPPPFFFSNFLWLLVILSEIQKITFSQMTKVNVINGKICFLERVFYLLYIMAYYALFWYQKKNTSKFAMRVIQWTKKKKKRLEKRQHKIWYFYNKSSNYHMFSFHIYSFLTIVVYIFWMLFPVSQEGFFVTKWEEGNMTKWLKINIYIIEIYGIATWNQLIKDFTI